jgi:DNA recombination protein RmuC
MPIDLILQGIILITLIINIFLLIKLLRKSDSNYELEDTMREEFARNRDELISNLKDLQTKNTEQLEKMRQTVDEKLHKTLETRLTESFKLVSDKLETV